MQKIAWKLSSALNNLDSLFSNQETYVPDYKRFMVDVILEVDSKKAYFFKAKKHLKSQEVVETKDNGNIVVKYRVTQKLEVETLIKSWLPHVKVIEPKSLKEKIEDELKAYLNI